MDTHESRSLVWTHGPEKQPLPGVYEFCYSTGRIFRVWDFVRWGLEASSPLEAIQLYLSQPRHQSIPNSSVPRRGPVFSSDTPEKETPELVIVGLDYDGTVTANLDLWWAFMLDARNRKTAVLITTMRFPPEPIDAITKELAYDIVYTGRQYKRDACKRVGYPRVDIWIDDSPDLVDAGSTVERFEAANPATNPHPSKGEKT